MLMRSRPNNHALKGISQWLNKDAFARPANGESGNAANPHISPILE